MQQPQKINFSNALSPKLALIAMGVGYALWASLSVYLARQPGNLAVLWFANAWAVGVLLSRPQREAPKLLLIQVLANSIPSLLYGDSLALLCAFSVSNAIETACASFLFRRVFNITTDVSTLEQLTKSLLFGVLLPCAIGATLGSATLSLAGLAHFDAIWKAWLIGDIYGYLSFYSLFRVVLGSRPGSPKLKVRADLLVWLVFTLVATYWLWSAYKQPYSLMLSTMMLILISASPLYTSLCTLAMAMLVATLKSEQWRQLVLTAEKPDLMQDLAPFIAVLFVLTLVQTLAQSLSNAITNLEREKRFLGSVTDYLPSLVFYWNRDLYNQFANESCSEWYGRPKSEFVGMHMADVLGPDIYAASEPFVKEALKGNPQTYFRTQVHRDGSTRHILVQYIPDIQNRQVLGFSSLVTDITELETARQKADASNQAKSNFLATMSHEIRTPMAAIIGLLQILEQTKLSLTQQNYLGKLKTASKGMLSLLNDILDFSKMEAGKLVIDKQPMQLDHFFRELADVLSASIGTKNLEILYDFDKDMPKEVLTDELRLRQIFLNIAGNAVKFTEKGHVQITAQVMDVSTGSEQSTPTDVWIRFQIIDTGIGIAPENIASVFKDFEQGEQTITRRFGGSGLGMAITKRLVELLGGNISVSSELGKGTTITFELPLELSAQEKEQQHSETPLATNVRHVLVVDDCEAALHSMNRTMQSFGWSVVCANSSDQALQIFEERLSQTSVPPFDCIYLDSRLTESSGWDTIGQLALLAGKALQPLPRFILLSSDGHDHPSTQGSSEAALLGAYLVKPVTPSLLFNASLNSAEDHSKVLSENETPGQVLRGIRILVVEDNAINQEVAQELLQNLGALVTIAEDGLQGTKAIATADTPYDIVLMDIQMPVMDGYTATRFIRNNLKLNADVLPIVGLTANAQTSDMELCLQAGMNAHVGKPFDIRELRATIIAQTRTPNDGSAAANASASSWTPARIDAHFQQNIQSAPDLDLDDALARMAGMKSLYVRSAKAWAFAVPENTSRLADLAYAGDHTAALALIHTLKGTSSTLGLMKLSASLAQLEKTVRETGDCKALLSQMEVIGGELRTGAKLLTVAVQNFEDIPTRHTAKPILTEAQSAEIKETLHVIRHHLEKGNLEALQVFASAQELLLTMAEKDYQALEDALQALDIAQALRICDRLLQEQG